MENNIDPFADRKHGPRTRARAIKEEEQEEEEEEVVEQSTRKVKKGKVSLKLRNNPTYASFSLLPPAAFPSLSPVATVEENEQILRQREIELCAESQPNPFFGDFDEYFAENQDPSRQPTYLSPTTLANQGWRDHGAETGKLGTGLYRPGRGPTVHDLVLDNTTQYYNTTGPDPHEYKTYLTQHSITGSVVRWHLRKCNTRPRNRFVPNFVPAPQHPIAPRKSVTVDLTTDRDSEIGIDKEEVVRAGGSSIRVKRSHPLLEEYKKRKGAHMMAENTAPMANSDDATRGMPYYDRLRKNMKTSIKEKQDSEETLAKIEQSIWNKEGSYLDDTPAGNIMKGFDNYIKASGAPGGSSTGGGTASRKKSTVSEQDRLFSRSSVGYWNSMRVRLTSSNICLIGTMLISLCRKDLHTPVLLLLHHMHQLQRERQIILLPRVRLAQRLLVCIRRRKLSRRKKMNSMASHPTSV